MVMAMDGMRKRAACLAVIMAFLAPAPAGAEGGKGLDFNAIVRSLAPIAYLPEHGGTAKHRRALDLEVQFAVNSAELTDRAAWQLDQLGLALDHPTLAELRFRIAGHTDASGDAAYNKALSKRRAEAVKRYMVERKGITADRLETEGWGEERLKDPINPSAGINRRVEVVTLVAEAGPRAKDEGQPAGAPGDAIRDILRGGDQGGASGPPSGAEAPADRPIKW